MQADVVKEWHVSRSPWMEGGSGQAVNQLDGLLCPGRGLGEVEHHDTAKTQGPAPVLLPKPLQIADLNERKR